MHLVLDIRLVMWCTKLAILYFDDLKAQTCSLFQVLNLDYTSPALVLQQLFFVLQASRSERHY